MTDGAADFEQQLRDANEQLYKHSHDLAVRNKTLSLLRRLYQMSIETLQPLELAKRIVDAVREELDLELVGVTAYSATSDTLIPVRFSASDRVATSLNGFDFSHTEIKNASVFPILKQVLSGTAASTSNLSDLWKDVASEAVLQRLQEDGHIKEVLVEPLRTGGNSVSGVLFLAFNRSIEDLSQFERESIDSLVDVVAIGLDRAQVYEELKLANERQVTLIHFITHQIKGFLTKSRNIFSLALEGDFGPVPDELKPMLQAGC